MTVCAAAVLCAPVDYFGGDPKGTLLASDALITGHGLRLDHFVEAGLSNYPHVRKKNEHYYYFFPIGTPLVAVPAVALGKLAGMTMPRDERVVQRCIVCVAALMNLSLLIALARLFLGPLASVVCGTVFWFGTSLASTTGVGLWSHAFAVMFSLAAIYLTTRLFLSTAPGWPQPEVSARVGESALGKWTWLLLGLCLFMAYLCRPTQAFLSPCCWVLVWLRHKKTALQAAAVVAVLLAAFAAFSLAEFAQVLPDYYLPSRLEGGNFGRALYGNLLSPARGLLVFSPFLLLVLLLFPLKNLDGRWPLLLVGLAWPVFHLLSISQFPHWWAGHSFGPRLMTDVLPGLFLLFVMFWHGWLKTGSRSLLVVFALAVAASVGIHTRQGMFNEFTVLWNNVPNINVYPEYLFDWRYPQFLAGHKGHLERLARHQQTP